MRRQFFSDVAKRIREYLALSGHAEDLEGPLFRPLSHNWKLQATRRKMDPDAIDRVLCKHCEAIGLDRGFSAHSMRATFITTALENGCSLSTYNAPQATASQAPPSSTTGAVTIRRVGKFLCHLLISIGQMANLGMICDKVSSVAA